MRTFLPAFAYGLLLVGLLCSLAGFATTLPRRHGYRFNGKRVARFAIVISRNQNKSR